MTDRTTSTVNTPVQSAPENTQEQAPETPVVVQTPEERAAVEAAERAELLKLLTATGRSYRDGLQGYCKGLLKAGEQATEYVHRRIILGDTRDAGVDAVKGEMAKYARDKVDVSRLIACSAAARLLCHADVAPETVPHGHWREYRQLVQRDTKQPGETWVLLPGVEEECKAAFAKCVANAVRLDGVQEHVKAIQRQYAEIQHTERRKLAQAAADEATAKAFAASEARRDTEQQEQTTRAAEVAAQTAKAEDKPALEGAAEKAKAELLAKQQALAAAVEEQARAEQQKARAAGDAKAAADAKAKAAAKEQAAQDRKAAKDKPPATSQPVTGNVLAQAAAQGTLKDVAAMVVELLTGTGTTEEALAEVLRQLKAGDLVHKRCTRSIDAFMLTYTRKDSPSPVDVAKHATTVPAVA